MKNIFFLLLSFNSLALLAAAADSEHAKFLRRLDIRFCATAHSLYDRADFGWEPFADSGCEIAGQEEQWFVVRKIGQLESVSYTAGGITRKKIEQFVADGSFARHYNHGVTSALMLNPQTAPVAALLREASNVHGGVEGKARWDGVASTTKEDVRAHAATVLEEEMQL